MASHTEGIALLSMYNDEEEEEEKYVGEERQAPGETPPAPEAMDEDTVAVTVADDAKDEGGAPAPPSPVAEDHDTTPPATRSRSPVLSDEDWDYKSLRSPTPPPLPRADATPCLALSTPSPPPPQPQAQVESLDTRRNSRGSLAIVDYGHDEMAMSPEQEEGEILSSGSMVIGPDLQASDCISDDKISPVNVQTLTPSTNPAPPQQSEILGQPKSETSTATHISETKAEVAESKQGPSDCAERQNDVDPMSSFLPPPLTTKCPEELQEKIDLFLDYKRAGKSFNAELRNKKNYRNPDFLQHAVRYQDIDQIGTCLIKDVFDPHGYDKSDYYDEIEADMKREMERREHEKKKSQKVDFVSGGAQLGTVAPLKIGLQVPGVSAPATTGLQSVSKVLDAASREVRQNKKTKWDKIDGDMKNPLQSGVQDNVSTVGVHAAHLSAANAGSGYTAFAMQKRREAEEKRSSERKFDKGS